MIKNRKIKDAPALEPSSIEKNSQIYIQVC